MSEDAAVIEILTNSERPIPAESVKALYETEPWWPERVVDDIEFVLSEQTAVGAWHGDYLIGFARAVCDLRFRAYIEDVLVLKSYRSRGTGTRLLNRLLEELESIDVITLFCRPRLSALYERLGFKEFKKLVVMHKRNPR